MLSLKRPRKPTTEKYGTNFLGKLTAVIVGGKKVKHAVKISSVGMVLPDLEQRHEVAITPWEKANILA